jgi:hypothetical protein
MIVKSNLIKTIKIEGISFTPSAKGVPVPADKVTALKKNFFFKHYVSSGSFVVTEDKTPAQLKAEADAAKV